MAHNLVLDDECLLMTEIADSGVSFINDPSTVLDVSRFLINVLNLNHISAPVKVLDCAKCGKHLPIYGSPTVAAMLAAAYVHLEYCTE